MSSGLGFTMIAERRSLPSSFAIGCCSRWRYTVLRSGTV
jgi:hypothetical protein